MTPLVAILTVAAYFALLVAIGRLAGRGAKGASFFNGGRRMPWPVVMISTIGAAISGVTFISVPGMVVGKGWSYVQMMLGFIVGAAVIAYVLVPLFYRNNVVSIYQYLEKRFGPRTYRSGAWMFFISKMLGASVRFLVVCAVLQMLVYGPLGLPFELNVGVAVALIWLYTAGGGVTSVIWTDVLKSVCLIASVALSIVCIASTLGLGLGEMITAVAHHPTTHAFHFSDPQSALWFGKQFVAGVFMVVVMTGLDQDMMQRNLACRDSVSSRKNVLAGSILQFAVIGMFLVLGTLLVMYVEATPGLEMPEKTDDLFGLVASSPAMPAIVGIVFIIGLVAAAYSAAGSALTSLTTSFGIDILGYDTDSLTGRRRTLVHLAMTLVMAAVILVFYHLSSEDAISAVYTLASYTYGPILGLFAFGLTGRRPARDAMVPVVCVLSPALAWLTQYLLRRYTGYETGFELLLINAAFTVFALWALPPKRAALPADAQLTPSES